MEMEMDEELKSDSNRVISEMRTMAIREATINTKEYIYNKGINDSVRFFFSLLLKESSKLSKENSDDWEKRMKEKIEDIYKNVGEESKNDELNRHLFQMNIKMKFGVNIE
ncbi:hypothetical protein SNEBB_000983 [Seison nebaliae]|nr:hypothetical protein SNEBB_000983 [Seison nebaliae]